jgi:hypothetical protein
MNIRDPEIVASLDKPGAGIPYPVMLLLRHVVAPMAAGRSTYDQNAAFFASSGKDIIDTCSGLSDQSMTTCVVVPPMRGLEDSSRYWSVSMTLEHIDIVGRAIIGSMKELAAGRVPARVANTVDVKPAGIFNGAQALQQYKGFYDRVRQELTPSFFGDYNSPLTYAHPWFGPMTIRQWHWMLAVHQNIHLKQIRAIKQILR